MDFPRKMITRSGCPWAIDDKVNSDKEYIVDVWSLPVGQKLIARLRLRAEVVDGSVLSVSYECVDLSTNCDLLANGLTCPPTATLPANGLTSWQITYVASNSSSAILKRLSFIHSLKCLFDFMIPITKSNKPPLENSH